jgi:predicted nucleic acid-binding protein
MRNINKRPKSIVLDSCFWIAYFDPRDNQHKDAREWSEFIFDHHVFCPFPTFYEFLNTRFSRNGHNQIKELDILMSKRTLNLIYDDNYRKNILDSYVKNNKYYPQFSLVDMVINEMIDDPSLKIDYLFTYNKKDFIKICKKRKVELLPE